MKTRYMTIKEASDFLRISYRTVQRYLSDGRIPYVKPAGRVLINEQDLMNFVLMVNR